MYQKIYTCIAPTHCTILGRNCLTKSSADEELRNQQIVCLENEP